jgi:hypothetical protein
MIPNGSSDRPQGGSEQPGELPEREPSTAGGAASFAACVLPLENAMAGGGLAAVVRTHQVTPQDAAQLPRPLSCGAAGLSAGHAEPAVLCCRRTGPAVRERTTGEGGAAHAARYATPEEVAQEIRRVCGSAGEMRRLLKAARPHAWGSDYGGRAQDLVSDAMRTAFVAAVARQQGRREGRAWRMDVLFLAYLHMTISGVGSDARRQAFFKRRIAGMIEELDLPAPEADEEDPEEQRQQEGVREKIRGDAEFRVLLDGLNAGRTPLEIQQQLQMTPAQYASLRRRLKRTLQRCAREHEQRRHQQGGDQR